MCVKFVFLLLVASSTAGELKDFDFEPEEMMIAQESRQYQTIVKPPVRIVKPQGVTNSHRPQYNIDSFEEDLPNSLAPLEEFLGPTTKKTIYDYKSSLKFRSKEGMIKEAVLRALERRDHVGKFAQILPIIRAMSGEQRAALASLVASQVTTPPGRLPLNLAQVRSMFGNSDNTTSELMLPILLDMANLIRRAVRSGKETRDVKPQILRHTDDVKSQKDQQNRRSDTDVTYYDDDTDIPQNIRRSADVIPSDHGQDNSPQNNKRSENATYITKEHIKIPNILRRQNKDRDVKPQFQRRSDNDVTFLDNEPFETGDTTTVAPRRRVRPQRTNNQTQKNTTEKTDHNRTIQTDTAVNDTVKAGDNKNKTKSLLTAESSYKARFNASKSPDNSSIDLATEATNQTLAQDLPVAEKLRAFNRFIDRKGTIRRGTYPPKPTATVRRTTSEPTVSPLGRRRNPPARKLPTVVADQGNCELFTNTLCLHSEDYPTEAIIQSIRRNKAAAGALLADFKDPGEGALDGVTAAQEAKYTADHYLMSNRRGDTANRDFASAGEAGFMCPSTVKYARPQRARATSGQWKYIVNTGEHTQTLRLEKCLKPKESCTYLTDNFKSKCVQVYNYHRLLTWDQQNGLHMDIFKVPTCCSCHIEGYSVSFPPLGHRVHETTSNEQFPDEDLSAEHGNGAFEQVQSSMHRPTKTPPFILKKPMESFPPFSDSHNLISGSPFGNAKLENDELVNSGNLQQSNPIDSYGNSYFPDSFNQATTSVRSVKRPPTRNVSPSSFDQVTLPSYLEPPNPSAASSFFISEKNKFKTPSQFKRGVRPGRRPIRKKIGGPDDLSSSGTSAVDNLESLEDFNDDLEEAEMVANVNVSPPKRGTIAPKLHAVVTTEKLSTSRSQEPNLKELATANSKRVNYNYHPIIDFFENTKQDENDSIDREDSVVAYVPTATVDSDWKPMNNPPSRSTSNGSLPSRKKHK